MEGTIPMSLDRKFQGEPINNFAPLTPWVGTYEYYADSRGRYAWPSGLAPDAAEARDLQLKIDPTVGLLMRGLDGERDLIRFTFEEWDELVAQVQGLRERYENQD